MFKGGLNGDRVKKIARNFKFSHGEKRVNESDKNNGVMAAWREAWTWRDQEIGILSLDLNFPK